MKKNKKIIILILVLLLLQLVLFIFKTKHDINYVIVSNDEKIKIGSYDTTPNFVARNWIEYNGSCVIFLKQNICTSDVSVLKVFDIDTKKVLDLTDEEKTEFYYNQFPNSKIKSKKLAKKFR